MPRLTDVNEQRLSPAEPKPAVPAQGVGPRMALALELFTMRRDPLPGLGRPKWLARLPHVFVAYAAVFFGFLTTEQLMDHYHVKGGPPLAVALLTALSIWLAMFRPIAAWWLGLLAAGWIAWMIHDNVGQGQTWPWTPGGMFAFAPVLLLVALRVPPRVTIWVVGVSVALTGAAELTFHPDGSQISSLPASVLFGFVGLLGYALRALRLARGELVEQETLTAEERARRTLLEERSRIARELHDVVAHHMSVISIQAQVAPHLVENPSEELRENLAGIRENALEALTELRRVLGVLRSEQPGDPAAPQHPQPTLAELAGLVDNVRGAGLDVTTEVAGIRRSLAPGVELTAYRIVQEALSNCLRHAPGSRVEVGVAYGPRELHLCIANSAPTRPAPPSQGAGHGLLGMRERAGMLGGELAAGPRPDGGYEVSAVLPMDPQNPAAGTGHETKKAP
ncbi:sensor histidine kinase [Streptomyces yangpuensis]|uniref:histidine kinase n=1 Tax=Streptomyces yangpuensis TaxID=1648182 RepID=A0ABY5PXQ8_9ACTN|nr:MULTISPECIES: sensor histidine kinase [Streptomyces]MBZ9597114.1 sensor histidine kinase [Streptomyces erythrochromogenes]UUY48942.1 sensor histidine kinase [Streptomyces yangpuensis]